MKSIALTALFAVSMFILTGCVAGPTPQQRMIASAKDVDQRFCDAFSRSDANAVMAVYWNSPDLGFYLPDMLEIQGWEAVKNSYAKAFAEGPPAKLELIDPHYAVAGDNVIGWGKWKMTLATPNAAPMQLIGRYTEVIAQKDGRWVYIIDHPSIPLSPPPGLSATSPATNPVK